MPVPTNGPRPRAACLPDRRVGGRADLSCAHEVVDCPHGGRKPLAKMPSPTTRKRHPADEARWTNAALYEAGKRYATEVLRLRAGGKPKAGAQDVAAENTTSAEEVAKAIDFADAVDLIAANCRGHARKLLLSDHPRLPAETVMKISRTHADRQRFALRQAKAGRSPLGKPPQGVAPPFDTHNPAEVLNRLTRNTGALDRVADGLLDTPAAHWPPPAKLAAMLDRAQRVRRHVRAMKPRVASSAVAPPTAVKKKSRQKARRERAPFDPKRALSAVAQAAGVTEKNDRDLPRVLIDTPPTAAEKEALLTRLRRLDAAAARLIAVIRAGHHDPRTGPSAVPGTYVVISRLAEGVRGLKVGALGTFDFPAGYYAYLGSAFGGGGVRKRTHRHLTRVTPRKWNIDHLKPLCTPVAVWWTHDRDKVEFDWAEILAKMPGASFPAPRFGAADNKKAKAHLVRFGRKPSIAEFRRRVNGTRTGPDVFEMAVEGWTGSGWPT